VGNPFQKLLKANQVGSGKVLLQISFNMYNSLLETANRRVRNIFLDKILILKLKFWKSV
jgi:hypothetical protein